jgi:excinuclease ABC subunit C
MVSASLSDRDVVAIRRDGERALACVLKVREGKLVAKEAYRLGFEGAPSDGQLLVQFLEQYLISAAPLPDEIVVEQRPPGLEVIRDWLKSVAGRPVRMRSPKGGKGRELLNMAGSNADLLLRQAGAESEARSKVPAAVSELQKWLHLPGEPLSIAAFDISNLQGAYPVGSRVFFRNGRPVKKLYRHYGIREVAGQDDFAMMREVLRRSWSHVVSGEEEAPDLVLVDGGKGQMSSAAHGMADAGADAGEIPPIAGIAKRLDEVYVPGAPEPIQIPHGSPALRLLQRIRDEAHRFAVTYHRKLRDSGSMASRLEGVRGIGPNLSKRLLQRYGSLDKMRSLGLTELLEVDGMTRPRARALLDELAGDRGEKGDTEASD